MLILIFLLSLLFLSSSGWHSPLAAQDTIKVEQDKDKTVYTIGSDNSNRDAQERDKERAWDMLRNMPVMIDGRGVQPPQPPRPTPYTQPAPVR
ncbi:MAG TPA: hypothetical protein VMT71_12335 [Syntrophorhabdales bacterium]|nr:hypothetical protein [Syntrophorhabdales bacterium]